ncbi:MAG: anthranilate phosphoribosyltransferase [Solirubrobacteraceae bacterium]|nr:anthranilate phosphoribosyltransferase [Solirubrobacteraceae bacterium]
MPDPIITTAIDAVASHQDLTTDQAAEVLEIIMRGDASEIQIAALLIGLRSKGETEDELAGLARTMRALATPVQTSRHDLVDTAGTGGGRQTFNVSTTAAIIAAGAGCAVAKHGNRSATGRSGSADVLEALGVRIDLTPEQVGRCIDDIGFGFMFAPAHHSAMRHVVPVRKELAVRTIFNFLGPLTNPAGARRQLIGVSDPAYVERIAKALARLGVDRALVVSSADELDEMSVAAPTTVIEVDGTELHRSTVVPEDVGLLRHRDPAATLGGGPEENAEIIRELFAGEHAPGTPIHDLSALNAGAAIYAAGSARTLREGVSLAAEAIADGRAAATLDMLVAVTGELSPA